MTKPTADSSHGQVSSSAAEIYESFFVPALFGQWPERVLQLAGVANGDTTIDVGCGTGIGARAARVITGSSGTVIGVDPNEGMLAVARSAAPDIEWHSGVAEALPLPDGIADSAISLFAAMFFTDTARAIAEMHRVTRAGGTIAITVWSSIEHSPGYSAMLRLLSDQLGDEAANALRAPFSLGDQRAFRSALGPDVNIRTVTTEPGSARFASVDEWLQTEIRGWTLAETVSERQFEALTAAAPAYLDDFVAPDKTVTFEAPALVAIIDT